MRGFSVMLYACPAVLFMRSQLRCAVVLNLRQQQQQDNTGVISASDMQACQQAFAQKHASRTAGYGCTTTHGTATLLAVVQLARCTHPHRCKAVSSALKDRAEPTDHANLSPQDPDTSLNPHQHSHTHNVHTDHAGS
jgi:hypothetical protein